MSSLKPVTASLPDADLSKQLSLIERAITTELNKAKPSSSVVTRLQGLAGQHRDEINRRLTSSSITSETGRLSSSLTGEMAKLSGQLTTLQGKLDGLSTEFTTKMKEDSLDVTAPTARVVQIRKIRDNGHVCMGMTQIIVNDINGVNVAKGKPVYVGFTDAQFDPDPTKDAAIRKQLQDKAQILTDGLRTQPTADPLWQNACVFNGTQLSIDLKGEFKIKEIIYVSAPNWIGIIGKDAAGPRHQGIEFLLWGKDNTLVAPIQETQLSLPYQVLHYAQPSASLYGVSRKLDGLANGQGPAARFIQIYASQNGADEFCMGIAQIIVKDIRGKVISIGKPMISSTGTRMDQDPKILTDGLRSKADPGNPIWHIAAGTGPLTGDTNKCHRADFLELDLQDMYPISEITYIGRDLPTNPERHRGIRFLLLDTQRQPVYEKLTTGTVPFQVLNLTRRDAGRGIVARKVRIRPAAYPHGSYMVINQVKVLNSAGDNVALNKPVVATSADRSESKNPTWINDGKRDTPGGIWGDGYAPQLWGDSGLRSHFPISENEYVEIDLLDDIPVEEIVFVGKDNMGGRNLGVRFELFDKYGRLVGAKATQSDAAYHRIQFLDTTGTESKFFAKKIRIRPSQTPTPEGLSWGKDAQGKDSPVDPWDSFNLNLSQIGVFDTRGVNVALEKPVAATLFESQYRPPSFVTDGLRTTPSDAPNVFQLYGPNNERNRLTSHLVIDLQGTFPISHILYVGRQWWNLSNPGRYRNEDVVIELLGENDTILKSIRTPVVNNPNLGVGPSLHYINVREAPAATNLAAPGVPASFMYGGGRRVRRRASRAGSTRRVAKRQTKQRKAGVSRKRRAGRR